MTDVAINRKRYTSFGLRLLVSGILLGVLLTRLNLDEVFPPHSARHTITYFIFGVVVTFFGFVLSAWRWQRVLEVFDEFVSLYRLSKIYFASIFVGNILPSTIGGDVLRISRMRKILNNGSVAAASVVLDRLTGFLALPLLCLAGFAMRPSLADIPRAWIALALAFGSLSSLVVVSIIAGSPRLAGRIKRHTSWRRVIGSIHDGLYALTRHRKRIAGVVLAAIVYQSSVVLAVWFAELALDISIPVAATLVVVPAVSMAQVLPISINGLGIREALLVIFLEPLGVSAARAVGLGLMWYAIVLVVSIAGAPSFAFARHHRD